MRGEQLGKKEQAGGRCGGGARRPSPVAVRARERDSVVKAKWREGSVGGQAPPPPGGTQRIACCGSVFVALFAPMFADARADEALA